MSYIYPPYGGTRNKYGKGKKDLRRLSLYVKPSDNQQLSEGFFFISRIYIFAKINIFELINYTKFKCSKRAKLYKLIPSSSS